MSWNCAESKRSLRELSGTHEPAIGKPCQKVPNLRLERLDASPSWQVSAMKLERLDASPSWQTRPPLSMQGVLSTRRGIRSVSLPRLPSLNSVREVVGLVFTGRRGLPRPRRATCPSQTARGTRLSEELSDDAEASCPSAMRSRAASLSAVQRHRELPPDSPEPKISAMLAAIQRHCELPGDSPKPKTSAPLPAMQRHCELPADSSPKSKASATLSAIQRHCELPADSPEPKTSTNPSVQLVGEVGTKVEETPARKPMLEALLQELYGHSLKVKVQRALLDSCPEVQWLAECAGRCPLSAGWREVWMRREETACLEVAYVCDDQGAVSELPPQLHSFVRLAWCVVHARLQPDTSAAMASHIREMVEASYTQVRILGARWTGPHLDPGTGRDYFCYPSAGLSSWQNPCKEHTFVAHCADRLLQSEAFRNTGDSKKSLEVPPTPPELFCPPPRWQAKEKCDVLASVPSTSSARGCLESRCRAACPARRPEMVCLSLAQAQARLKATSIFAPLPPPPRLKSRQ
eukprot:TRINITY_DN102133_c0_g1_i1.p1 TRINITY_DN102133_c0_g1~~TRINITY_DN102133_c0_g1_i1.p1  ORF type:complete len:520 (+),score=85.31 TRINITY_DN102133_c0_g1_i1:46-1605(+)